MRLQYQRGTSFENRYSKDNHFQNQLIKLDQFLKQFTVSRWMASELTGIPLQSVCLHVKELRENNAIAVAKYDKCKISGRFVEFLTTDPERFPTVNQLKLF